MPFKFDPKRPIYLQIMENIKEKTVKGELSAGSAIPSVRNLAVELQVNANTVARAYQELEREGFTFTKRGEGSFINNKESFLTKAKQEIVKKMFFDFKKNLESMGLFDSEMEKKLNNIEKDLK